MPTQAIICAGFGLESPQMATTRSLSKTVSDKDRSTVIWPSHRRR
jgi:hypothetical protein